MDFGIGVGRATTVGDCSAPRFKGDESIRSAATRVATSAVTVASRSVDGGFATLVATAASIVASSCEDVGSTAGVHPAASKTLPKSSKEMTIALLTNANN